MTFDLFGYGRYMYTFKARCEQEPECRLENGATQIFLNTRGKNDHEISTELKDFLYYLEHTTDATVDAVASERIKRIHRRVCKVRASEEAGVRYMQAWEEKYYEREEGLKEGLKKGREEGIQAMVTVCGEVGLSKERTIEKLQKNFALSAKDAARYFENFCPGENSDIPPQELAKQVLR